MQGLSKTFQVYDIYIQAVDSPFIVSLICLNFIWVTPRTVCCKFNEFGVTIWQSLDVLTSKLYEILHIALKTFFKVSYLENAVDIMFHAIPVYQMCIQLQEDIETDSHIFIKFSDYQYTIIISIHRIQFKTDQPTFIRISFNNLKKKAMMKRYLKYNVL